MTSKCKTVTWTSVQLQNWHLQKPCSTLRRLQLLLTNGFQIDFKRLKLCTVQDSPNDFSYVQDKQNRCKLHCKSLFHFSTKLASHKAEQVISPNVILLKSGEPRTKKSYTTWQGESIRSQKHSYRNPKDISTKELHSFFHTILHPWPLSSLEYFHPGTK